MWQCKACGRGNPAHNRFCLACGVEPTPTPAQSPSTGECSGCGRQNAPHMKYCLACGAELAVSRERAMEGSDPRTARRQRDIVIVTVLTALSLTAAALAWVSLR